MIPLHQLTSLILRCAECGGPMDKRYSVGLVALSITIAIAASHSALDLASRVARSAGVLRRVFLAGGALAMGVGIWSMHFVGMLALIMPMPVTYDLTGTVASMLLAIVGSLCALVVASSARLTRVRLVVGGVLMGCAINAMHYTGMAAMRMPASLRYDVPLFVLSVVIAIAASMLALRLAFDLRADGSMLTKKRVLGAVAMGAGIAGMHYTGMAAASFVPTAGAPVAAGVEISFLGAVAIGTGTLVGLGLSLLASLADRERRRAIRQLEFLSKVGSALLRARDREHIIRTTCELVVEWGVDLCVLDVVDDRGDGTVLRALARRGSPSTTTRAALPPPSEETTGWPAAHRSVDAEEVWDLAGAAWSRWAAPEVWLQEARDVRPTSAVAISIPAGEQPGGALLLCSGGTQRYGRAEILVGSEIAFRVAAALESVRRMEELQSALSARERFLTIASHELRTPLTPARMHVQRLRRELKQGQLIPERLDERLEKTERQIDRLAKLVEQLLDVSRLQRNSLSLNFEPVDFREIVEHAIAALTPEIERANIPLDVQLEPALTGSWDRLRLEEIVTNLLGNAVKYGAGNPISLRAYRDGDSLVFWIRDAGIGIAPEDQVRMFAPFERADTVRNLGGLGVGLYIVRDLVEAFGGSIDVESELGRGSTFTVRLPLTREQGQSGLPPPRPGDDVSSV